MTGTLLRDMMGAKEEEGMAYRGPLGACQTIIFHVDVNSAFLSWSALKKLKEEPGSVDLRTIPSAVAGDVTTRHGIITAKSIPAKKYGVRTAEPVASALRKCPGLVLVKSDFTTYRAYSRAFTEILRTYSPQVEKVSIDEAFLDMSGAEARFAGEKLPELPFPINVAERMKNEIRDTLGFTVNVGISTNKLLAKTASDFEKPDRIHTLWPEEVEEKLWPLPIGELFGCGAATAEKLKGIGIATIGDAAHADPQVLRMLLGNKGGEYIYASANGRGSSKVEGTPEEAKGYSNESTTAHDITADNYEKEGPPLIRELAENVARRLARDGVCGQTIGVMVKTDRFRRRSRQTTLYNSTNDVELIDRTAQKLMRELLFGDGELFPAGTGIRLMGVSATKLDHGEYRQLSLFDDGWKVSEKSEISKEKEKGRSEEDAERERRRAEDLERRGKLDAMLRKVKERYGEGALRRGPKAEDESGGNPPENPKTSY